MTPRHLLLGAAVLIAGCAAPAPAAPTGSAPAAGAGSPSAPVAPGSATSGFGVQVAGNHLVDAQTGAVVQLRGINQMAGAGCTGTGRQSAIIYGPSDVASLAALQAWHVNAVRLSLNEDCWLGINGVPAATGGASYRDAITSYVALLTSHHYYAIVDLHVNAPGTQVSDAEQPMADEDHAPAYWTSVATTFRDDPAVIFEPYNEPHITTADTAATDPWACWLHGCQATMVSAGPHATHPQSWPTAGMQQLVDTIRATGAANVITLSGLDLASDLSGILSHLPHDPDHRLAATFHNYGVSATSNGGCGPSCWDSTVAAVAARMPVITDEMGQADCGTGYVTAYLTWADAHGVSYLPWGWELWGCANHAYGLLATWSGTPNAYGQVFFDHFAQRAQMA